jgi:osmotically-inducible protein OsmY
MATAVLAAACAGCPATAITMGAARAASILADDRSLEQQAADVGVKAEIERALLDDAPHLAEAVNVDVFLGRVMLTGVVPDESARGDAAAIARDAAQGREVYDDIEVARGGGVAGEAENIAVNKALGVNLLADEGLASQSLLHRVVDATAFVMGEVQDWGQIGTVRQVALQTTGVQRVVTHIVVEP